MLVLSGYASDQCPEAISNPCVGRVVEGQTRRGGWQVQEIFDAQRDTEIAADRYLSERK